MADETHGREITLEELMTLRASTEAVSTWLHSEVGDRLETLRPLMAPRRFLGEHVKSAAHDEVRDADKTFALLQTSFRDVSGEPLRVSSRLDSPIESIPSDLQLHPWEYTHETSAGDARKLAVKSPVSWVLTHATPLGLSQVRQMISGTAARNEVQLKQFAVNAVLMKIIFDKSPGLVRLLGALRLQVGVTTTPETGKLPLVRLSASIPAFRPADSALLNATRLSGVAIFEELVDLDALQNLEDPIRAKLLQLAKG